MHRSTHSLSQRLSRSSTVSSRSSFGEKPRRLERSASKAIDLQLKQEKQLAGRSLSVLLMSPNSLQQKRQLLKALYIMSPGLGVDIEEKNEDPDRVERLRREQERTQVRRALVSSMRTVLNSISELGIKLSPKLEKQASAFLTGTPDLTPNTAAAISTFWRNECVRQAAMNSTRIGLDPHVCYLFSQAEAIAHNEYQATQDDVLATLIEPNALNEVLCQLHSMPLRCIDIGGLHTEQRKWLHSFESIFAIIHLVSVASLTRTMFEDGSGSDVEEAFVGLEAIATSQWLSKTPIIVVFSGVEVLERHLDSVDVHDIFPDYYGSNNIDDVIKYLRVRVSARLADRAMNDSLYFHVSERSVVTDLPMALFQILQDLILREGLRNAGIL